MACLHPISHGKLFLYTKLKARAYFVFLQQLIFVR